MASSPILRNYIVAEEKKGKMMVEQLHEEGRQLPASAVIFEENSYRVLVFRI